MHESRETVYPKIQNEVTFGNKGGLNYKQNKYCKQTKRNSFELAKSHRLFTEVNGEKTEGQEIEKTRRAMRSMLWRRPIKIIGKDIDQQRRSMPPAGKRTNQSHTIYLEIFKITQNHPKSPETIQNHAKPPTSTVGVLTDRPPGDPFHNSQFTDSECC